MKQIIIEWGFSIDKEGEEGCRIMFKGKPSPYECLGILDFYLQHLRGGLLNFYEANIKFIEEENNEKK